jgi:hypothetical protein
MNRSEDTFRCIGGTRFLSPRSFIAAKVLVLALWILK